MGNRPTALFLMGHAAFRRDAGRSAERLRTRQEPERIARLALHWELYSGMLWRHHQQEDAHLFGTIARADERVESLIAELEREHAELDPLLVRFGELLEARPTTCDELDELFKSSASSPLSPAKVDALLEQHLSKEEEFLIPIMRVCGIFSAAARSRRAMLWSEKLHGGRRWRFRGSLRALPTRCSALSCRRA